MADGARPGGGRSAADGSETEATETAELEDLARDWITLWQSELAAMATDRELQEGWQALIGLWAAAATVFARGLPRQRSGERARERATGRAGAVAAARTAAAAAAPDARDAEIERLGRHIAELEQRLAGVERGVRPGGGPRSGAGRGGGRKRPG